MTMTNIPLKTVQSNTLQLYPRLKSVLTILLPYPNEMVNHMRILIIFMIFIPCFILLNVF